MAIPMLNMDLHTHSVALVCALAVILVGEVTEVTAVPTSCSRKLAETTPGTLLSDGMQTISNSDLPSSVFCDQSTDRGGWTLVAYALGGSLGAPLTASFGEYLPLKRNTSVGLKSANLAQASYEMAISWSTGGAMPTYGIRSYTAAVAFELPKTPNITLDTTTVNTLSSVCSNTSEWTARTVRCIHGTCNLPSTMYTRLSSFSVAHGQAYGLVANESKITCDWVPGEGGAFQTLYLSVNSSRNGTVVPSPGGASNEIDVSTMAVWLREDVKALNATLSLMRAGDTSFTSLAAGGTKAMIGFKVNFTEVVTSFGSSSVSVVNGTASSFTSSNNQHWEFWVTPSGGPWSVQVVAAGSHSSSRNFPNSASDTVTGVATVALSQTSLTPLPVSNATTPTWVLPLTFVVEFGEAVTGFTAGDVTIQTISMVGTPTVAANVTTRELRGSSNSTYTLGVNPPYENGTFIVKIAVAAATAVRSQYHKTPALTSTVVVGVNCPPGQWGPNRNNCTTCIGNKYSLGGASSCSFCTNYTFADSGYSSCGSCPVHKANATECGKFNSTNTTTDFLSGSSCINSKVTMELKSALNNATAELYYSFATNYRVNAFLNAPTNLTDHPTRMTIGLIRLTSTTELRVLLHSHFAWSFASSACGLAKIKVTKCGDPDEYRYLMAASFLHQQQYIQVTFTLTSGSNVVLLLGSSDVITLRCSSTAERISSYWKTP